MYKTEDQELSAKMASRVFALNNSVDPLAGRVTLEFSDHVRIEFSTTYASYDYEHLKEAQQYVDELCDEIESLNSRICSARARALGFVQSLADYDLLRKGNEHEDDVMDVLHHAIVLEILPQIKKVKIPSQEGAEYAESDF